MPKLTPAQIADRRRIILSAAEQCFARNGFHRTTMQDICREAKVSPGALYLYFKSKEALIEGLCERDREELIAAVGDIEDAPNIMMALHDLLMHYCVEEPAYRRIMMVELSAEANRNPVVADLMQRTDKAIHDRFRSLLERAMAQGRLIPKGDPVTTIDLLMTLADGTFFRTATVPTFDARDFIPRLFDLLTAHVLVPNPVEAP